jgi:conjugal transfer pilus assembly protein TraB
MTNEGVIEPAINNVQVRWMQKRNLLIVLAFIVLATLATVVVIISSKASQNRINQNATVSTKMSALGTDIKDGSLFVKKLEDSLSLHESKLSEEESKRLTWQKDMNDAYANQVSELKDLVQQLEQRLEAKSQPVTMESDEGMPREEMASNDYPQPMSFSPKNAYGNNHQSQYEGESFVQQSTITVDNMFSENVKPKKVSNYIAAGTIVKAVLIQGIDASASVTSQADPRPVLLRLVSDANLPNEVRGKAEDCRIIGAAYGDISSERAFIRLESFSCTLKNNNILESIVEGYVVGEDGKAGMRGVVVRREADLLTKSFISGMVSGFSKGISDSYQSSLISPLGVVSETKSNATFKRGAAEGGSSALDRLSKSFIERADQYQPVIQIGAGREVDVVFKRGFHLHSGSMPLVLAQE